MAQTMADRREWEHATVGSRHLAVAADGELRRRHPDQPHRAAAFGRTSLDQGHRPRTTTPAPDEKIGQMAAWIRDLDARRQAFREKLYPAQSPSAGSPPSARNGQAAGRRG